MVVTGAAFDQIRAAPSRSVADIRGTGAAWVAESELEWLCDCADALRVLEREHEQLQDALEQTDGALRAVLARKPVRDADEILAANAWLLFPAPVAVEVPADE